MTNIFISYTSKDRDTFRIPIIVNTLKSFSNIENVYFLEADAPSNIIQYMNDAISAADIILAFFSPTSRASKWNQFEWTSALQFNKVIIPIFINIEDIPLLLRSIRAIHFNQSNIDESINKIYRIIAQLIQVLSKEETKEIRVPISKSHPIWNIIRNDPIQSSSSSPLSSTSINQDSSSINDYDSFHQEIGKKRRELVNELKIEDDLKANRIFLIHGRNKKMKKSIRDFLTCLNIDIVEWEDGVSKTEKPHPFNHEIIEAAFKLAEVLLILFTPDDLVKLKEEFWNPNEREYEKTLQGQARPNVIYEAGLAMGMKSKNTVLVEFGNLRHFSDIEGFNVIRLNNSESTRDALINRLNIAGMHIKLSTRSRKWKTVGDFLL